MIKAVIFDIDGVLVDSRDANVALFQKLLQKAGYPPASRKKIQDCFHLPLWESLERLTGTKDQTEIKRIWDMAHDVSLRNPELFEFPVKLEQVLEDLHKSTDWLLLRVESELESTIFSMPARLSIYSMS